MKGFMVQGTSSDSGKSFIVTGFCRLLSDMGFKVCPFKSQNMSNNSYVTDEGLEIGRAQGVQAEAARTEPKVHMNPILLKPRKDTSSDIVLFGKHFDAPCDINYYRTFTMNEGLDALRASLKTIEADYDLIVSEGAGSPAEINLNSSEIVNMRVAREADIPVILVTDVDRGGAMASVVGTLELLGGDRKRVKGIIFNKFRGNISLFQDAVKWTEDYTGIKVLGVVPWTDDLVIEGEDVMSINWERNSMSEQDPIRIGSFCFSRISNHTDLEPFRLEPDVSVSRAGASSDLGSFDAIILPDTRSVVRDLELLRETGASVRLKDFVLNGGFVFGIGAGWQMMGETIIELRTESGISNEIEGLNLIPAVTTLGDNEIVMRKRVRSVHPSITEGLELSGYVAGAGSTSVSASEDGAFFPLFNCGGAFEGVADASLRRAGTYLHDVFRNDIFRNIWLNKIRVSKGLPEREPVDTSCAKEEAYNRLAGLLREHLDVDYVIKHLIGM